MNERLETLCVTLHAISGAAATDFYFEALTDMVIVGVSAAPSVDDAGADIDIADDGTDVITAVDASDQDVPGTWQAKGYGGSNDPVVIAKDSLVKINANDNANDTAFFVVIHFLRGEDWK